MLNSPVKQLYGGTMIDTMFNMLQQNKKVCPGEQKFCQMNSDLLD